MILISALLLLIVFCFIIAIQIAAGTHSLEVDATLASRTADTEFTVGTITLPAGGQKKVHAIAISVIDDPGVSAVAVHASPQIRFDSSAGGWSGTPQVYTCPGFMSAPAGTNPAIAWSAMPYRIPVDWTIDGSGAITVFCTLLDEAPTGGTIQVSLIFT
jgi:hypothetical protein